MLKRRYIDQFTLRLDEEVMQEVKRISKDTGKSLQFLLNEAVLKWLRERSEAPPPGETTSEVHHEPTVYQDPFFQKPTTFINLD